jgi:hypothetical protein
MAKRDVMRAIREKCLDCCCGQAQEVKLCEIRDCALHQFRFGKDPTAKKTGESPLDPETAQRLHDLRAKTSGANN